MSNLIQKFRIHEAVRLLCAKFCHDDKRMSMIHHSRTWIQKKCSVAWFVAISVMPAVACAQDGVENDAFFHNDGWVGGTEFVQLLGTPYFDLSLNELEKGDVAILIEPDKTMLSKVSVESFLMKGVRVVIFDETNSEKALFPQKPAAGMDRRVSHINGNPDIPVIKAHVTFPWKYEPWEGQVALNHPAPVTGVAALVGNDDYAYVWSPRANVWIVRDASIVTNFMISMYDNESFIQAITSCEDACKQVLYTPRRIIERGEPDSIPQRVVDSFDQLLHFFNDQKDVLSYFPWLKLILGIIFFWLIMTAGISFPTYKDV